VKQPTIHPDTRIQSPKTRRILFVLLILNLCFIWGNSLMPADISGAFSGWAKDLINSIFHFWNGSGAALNGDGVLRKIAHASEFAALGALLTLLLGIPGKLFHVLFYGMTTALIDETIQLFSAGRAARVTDVWIDFGGLCVGLALTALIRERVKLID